MPLPREHLRVQVCPRQGAPGLQAEAATDRGRAAAAARCAGAATTTAAPGAGAGQLRPPEAAAAEGVLCNDGVEGR